MKKKGKQPGLFRTALFGVILGVVIAVILALTFAMLCEKGIVPENKILLTGLISLFAAVFVSTLAAGKRASKMKFPAALCVGAIELIGCILLHTLLLQGAFYHILWISVIFAIATGAGGLLAVQKRKKRKFA